MRKKVAIIYEYLLTQNTEGSLLQFLGKLSDYTIGLLLDFFAEIGNNSIILRLMLRIF